MPTFAKVTQNIVEAKFIYAVYVVIINVSNCVMFMNLE